MTEKEEVIDNEFDPVIWDEHGDIRLQDLQLTMIQEALELLKKYAIPKNPLWINLNIDKDETIIDEYCTRLVHVLKDCCSIVALSIETGKLLALAVCKIMSIDEYDWTLWKIMPTKSEKLEKIFTLQYDIIKSSELKKGVTFHCFDICVAEELAEQNYENILLKQAYEAAKSLKTNVFTFSCFTKADSVIAEKSSMHLSHQIHYALYTDSVGERIFKNIENEQTAFLFKRKISSKRDNHSPDE